MNYNDGYAAGGHMAWKAIAAGFPRWMNRGDQPLGQYIDPGTGLPFLSMSGPPTLAAYHEGLARGHNEAISAGIRSGEVTVDFRPLLMSRPETLTALQECRLGTISTDDPRLAAPNGEFVFQLHFPRPNVKHKQTWISYRRGNDQWPNFDLYEGPLAVALGRAGRVLVFKSSSLITTRDAETTQVLNSYPC
jgi:hypothetical protein